MPHPSKAPLVDIHCHLLPEIDDGAATWEDSLAMARMAAADGITRSSSRRISWAAIGRIEARRSASGPLNCRSCCAVNRIPLKVLPGADVRIEADMLALLRSGDVLTLADRRRHVLLELPHELYMPLEPVLAELQAARMTGILSHPERNQGLLADPAPIARLVDAGCLMQLTAGSLLGAFGPAVQQFSESLLAQGLVHFVSSDAHGDQVAASAAERCLSTRGRRSIDEQTAHDLCCRHPALVAEGEAVPADGGQCPSGSVGRACFPGGALHESSR